MCHCNCRLLYKISNFLTPSPIITYRNPLILFLSSTFWEPPPPTHCGRHIRKPPNPGNTWSRANPLKKHSLQIGRLKSEENSRFKVEILWEWELPSRGQFGASSACMMGWRHAQWFYTQNDQNQIKLFYFISQ